MGDGRGGRGGLGKIKQEGDRTKLWTIQGSYNENKFTAQVFNTTGAVQPHTQPSSGWLRLYQGT